MKWDKTIFAAQARIVLNRYMNEHTWYSWDRSNPERHIELAWKLYEQANQNALGLLLLGDAKIRTNAGLLRNFGVTSGNLLSDEREKQQVDALQRERQALAGPRSGPTPAVLGPGSILNDQGWSPLLNDAFILGGVHGGQEFHWAEEGFGQFNLMGEREFLQRRAAFGEAAPQYAAALSRDEAYYKGRWKHYVMGRSNFWLEGLVRIFARELLGLRAFGYRPVFTGQAMSFAPGGGTSRGTFHEYLMALGRVNFFKNDKAAINAALGEFLFDDAKALDGLSTGAPKPPGQHLLKKTGITLPRT